MFFTLLESGFFYIECMSLRLGAQEVGAHQWVDDNTYMFRNSLYRFVSAWTRHHVTPFRVRLPKKDYQKIGQLQKRFHPHYPHYLESLLESFLRLLLGFCVKTWRVPFQGAFFLLPREFLLLKQDPLSYEGDGKTSIQIFNEASIA